MLLYGAAMDAVLARGERAFADRVKGRRLINMATRVKGAKLVAHDFAVQAAISNVLENVRLIAGAAREAGIASPLLDVCVALYGETSALGLRSADMIAVIRWRLLALDGGSGLALSGGSIVVGERRLNVLAVFLQGRVHVSVVVQRVEAFLEALERLAKACAELRQLGRTKEEQRQREHDENLSDTQPHGILRRFLASNSSQRAGVYLRRGPAAPQIVGRRERRLSQTEGRALPRGCSTQKLSSGW